MTPEVESALATAIDGLRTLDLGDAFEPRAAEVIVKAGLHRLCVPTEAGGLGVSMADAAEVLMALGAVDGATALGFAMQVHVTGAMRDATAFPDEIRDRVWRAVVDDGALLNNAATEEGGGSPARGAVPGTTAVPGDDGTWWLTGEKTWTTWLPKLTHAFVTARIGDTEPPEVGTFLIDLGAEEADGHVGRGQGFEAMGMRGSASGRLAMRKAPAELVQRRRVDQPEPRGAAPGAWFGIAMAATYLGVGEGARTDVAGWAVDRRPGDGSTAVADLPSVQLRLGRMDLELRAARIVVLDAARRWDTHREAADIAMAKLVATRAACIATDEALRIAGGPGFLAGRLERAFRDARAGLINPPLEDVALGGFGKAVVERERGR
ncbi:MAG: acyl-CoA dehydrogenase family protein [Candidatus Limnocylindrales bacterium]